MHKPCFLTGIAPLLCGGRVFREAQNGALGDWVSGKVFREKGAVTFTSSHVPSCEKGAVTFISSHVPSCDKLVGVVE